MQKWVVVLLVFFGMHQCSEGAKILIVYAVPVPSQSILGEGYVRLLLDAGHEITYITPFPKSVKDNPRLHIIDVSELLALAPANTVNIQKVVDNEVKIAEWLALATLFPKVSESLLKNENVLALINDPTQHFDLVINLYSVNEVFAGFAALYKCPYIWSFSIAPESMILSLIHEHLNPAVYPDPMSIDMPPLSFTQRVKTLFKTMAFSAFQYLYMYPRQKVLYEETFGPIIAKRGGSLPPYGEIIFNASFVLANSHEALSYPVSLPPNCKLISGYYIDVKNKPMEKDLQQIMDNAKDGVVYFSMGSHLKSKYMPEIMKQDLLKVFGGLKQTVIWKLEEDFPNLPKNVHILKWAPQQNILAHNNTRLFITHGGLGSTTETIHFGVPVITIPVATDQFVNAEKAVVKGYGRKVDLSYNIAGDLKLALDDILEENYPKYAAKAKEVSMIYHDRPVPPAKELVHWVEHAIKTRGAPHLRSPALMLSWYQKIYLDLIVLILVVLIVLRIVVRRLWNLTKVSKKQKTL